MTKVCTKTESNWTSEPLTFQQARRIICKIQFKQSKLTIRTQCNSEPWGVDVEGKATHFNRFYYTED